MAAPENRQDQSYLDMSDEEIMNMAPPDLAPVEDSVPEDEDAPDDAAAEQRDGDAATEEADAGAEPNDDDGADADETAPEGDAEPENPDTDTDVEDDADPDKPDEKDADQDEKDDKDDKKDEAIDYKAAYERLMAPFKANGREIAVKSVDDAITLMQMGANYNKKMAALKPNLKLLKLLENNNLLSEEKISFLIDLERKDPAAINKLVKDSGVDPMDLDAEKASEYKQTTYTVDEREIELDTVLDELSATPTYTRTLDVVSNKWDGKSKEVIATTPVLLKVINDHMQSGIYDIISAEMENERLFGRLNGMSDIEAYRHVGDAINARGGFNHLTQGSSPDQAKPAAEKQVIVPPKPKKVEDDKLKDRRRAASPTKPVASAPVKQDFDPLALSDEEFLKLATPRYN